MTQIYHFAKAYQEQLLQDAKAGDNVRPEKKKPVLMLIGGTFSKLQQRFGSGPSDSSKEKHLALDPATRPG